MWRPSIPINFLTLHYAWICWMSLLGLLVIAPYGNVKAVDAFFFGTSASTESGLNTFDVKDLKLYQQLYIYFSPIFTNLGFINFVVVAVRLYWFEKKLGEAGKLSTKTTPPEDPEASNGQSRDARLSQSQLNPSTGLPRQPNDHGDNSENNGDKEPENISPDTRWSDGARQGTHITFDVDSKPARGQGETLYVPPPWQREKGRELEAVKMSADNDHTDLDSNGVISRPTSRGNPSNVEIPRTSVNSDSDAIKPAPHASNSGGFRLRHEPHRDSASLYATRSIERTASSFLAVGGVSSGQSGPFFAGSAAPRQSDLPGLSRTVTIGRNSRFYNTTPTDRERLGGIEYRSLKLLAKISFGYFFGLHLFGAMCLLGWIHHAPLKYTDYLAECGQDKTWWAFYSAQTMVDNLGFTLTPDSMAHFKDATWPLIAMTFLAFAGNTLYPVLLRLLIWTMYKLVPAKSSVKETLHFILQHPRRCYTLLFPSRPTWILFAIIFALNLTDVVIIIVLDLDNPAVNDLPMGPRILSAIFQAASSRHTGTSTLNLAEVNPAVQFSLVIMMYIAILPIAISCLFAYSHQGIRSSNVYEERALGRYPNERHLNERNGASYVMDHVRNQLSFDLWYIFLSTFCICIAESDRIADVNESAFSVFSVFFEVVSGYGNVGLSLGYPTVSTSLSGVFTSFSKIVMCLTMIRGRHRALPYALDRAVMLPGVSGTELAVAARGISPAHNELKMA